jgi:hypothetical protein
MGSEEEDRDRQKKEDTDSPVFSPDPADSTNVTGLLSERIENLVQAIGELDTALIQRKALNDKFLEQITEERAEITHQLSFLNDPWKTGFYPEIEFLRLSFHKSLTSRAKDSRTEELKYWQDILKLVMDRRKLVDEYNELLAAKKRLE